MKKFFGKIKGAMKKLWEMITNKWLLKGTTTVLLVALVIAGYVALDWVGKNIKIEDWDLTSKKLYSLSTETKNKIKDLKNEITIQLINMSEYTYVVDYAKKYEKASEKIKVEEIADLSTRLDLQTKYKIEPSDAIIVVSNGERQKILVETDLYTYDYSTYESIDITEEALTNAIVEVTIEKKPKIYILAGKTYYNPENLLGTILSKLEDEANEVSDLNIITTGKVPDDCNCLIITTLKEDITDFEKEKILEYINKGGKILMLTSQNILDVKTPNFNAILALYGASIEYGAVFEQDGSKMLQGSPEMVIAEASASFMPGLDMTLNVCMLDAGKITFVDDEKLKELDVAYEAIAFSSGKSFVRTKFDIIKTSRTKDDSEEGECILGARVLKDISDDITSELIIYSNELFATDMQIGIGGQYYLLANELHNNQDVILNSVSHLTEREDTIMIRKTDETQRYTVTDQEDVVIKTIIFVVPVLIIGAGIVVWAVRRRSI